MSEGISGCLLRVMSSSEGGVVLILHCIDSEIPLSTVREYLLFLSGLHMSTTRMGSSFEKSGAQSADRALNRGPQIVEGPRLICEIAWEASINWSLWMSSSQEP